MWNFWTLCFLFTMVDESNSRNSCVVFCPEFLCARACVWVSISTCIRLIHERLLSMCDHVMNDAVSPHPNVHVYDIAKRPYIFVMTQPSLAYWMTISSSYRSRLFYLRGIDITKRKARQVLWIQHFVKNIMIFHIA